MTAVTARADDGGSGPRSPGVSTGAAAVELLNSRVRGAVTAGNQVGSLTCSGRGPAPVDLGAPNAVRGATSGQCRIGSTPAA